MMGRISLRPSHSLVEASFGEPPLGNLRSVREVIRSIARITLAGTFRDPGASVPFVLCKADQGYRLVSEC